MSGGNPRGMLVAVSIVVMCISISEGGNEMGKLDGKKIVMVIASSNFRDEEFQVPKGIFEKQGASVTVASSSLKESRGMLGATAKPDVLIGDVRSDDYDAVVFIGGSGASEYWNDPTAHKLARDASEKAKVVAAICIAPVTLANAGILNGKKATVWSSEAGKLRKMGVTYTGAGVEVDGKIITGDGPQSATEFGEAVVKALSE
jgi:protease I